MSVRLGHAARLATRGEAQWFRAPALAHPEVVHGVTHSSWGNFSRTTSADPAAVDDRRRRFLEEAGLGFARMVSPGLHHTADVAVVDRGVVPDGKYDAFVTLDPATVLAVTVADCVPVFFLDAAEGAIGVAHAGWRGMAGDIVRKTVRVMVDQLGVQRGNLLVAVGPAIRGPRYEVGPDVSGLFPEEFTVPVGDPGSGQAQLDLPSCALAQAAAERIPRDNLVDFSLCTLDHPDDLFSHRRGDRDRHWAFIGRA
jgi:hypothetical protein